MATTTRRLIVMRHAKSSWADASMTDHERPLNDRGRRAAPQVAARLTEIGWQPEFVISSDAARTRETLDCMCAVWGPELDCEYFRSLYLAGYESVLQESSVVDPNLKTLMVLGHNPGWEGLIASLAGESVVMKTANAALLEGEGETWRDAIAKRRSWKLIDVVRARDLE